MTEIYKIIGLRDVDPNIKEEATKFINTHKSEEATQIKKGYTNPLMVSNILVCRAKCLGEKFGVK